MLFKCICNDIWNQHFTFSAEHELIRCQALYDLLNNEECRNLILTVLSLVITRTVGKTPEALLSDETVITDLKTKKINNENVLPENCHRFLSCQKESRTSIDVHFGLIKLLSNKNPKTGWGTPVKGSDIEIGDDVERLHRVFFIFKEISKPADISLKNYVYLLRKILTACTRLGPDDGTLDNNCQEFFDKLEAIINPNLKKRWPKLNRGLKVVTGAAIVSLAAFILHKTIR